MERRRGRQELRQRVAIEHALALVGRRPRARYLGVRKNDLDLCRPCAVGNLITRDRAQLAAQEAG